MTSIMACSRTVCYLWKTLLGRMLRARPGNFFMMTVLLLTMMKLIVVILDSQLAPH